MTEDTTLCGVTWALDSPPAEDAPEKQHKCIDPDPLHEDSHVCSCGAQSPAVGTKES